MGRERELEREWGGGADMKRLTYKQVKKDTKRWMDRGR